MHLSGVPCLIYPFPLFQNPIVLSRLVIIGIDLFLDIPVMIAVAILTGYHIYCLTTNTTTIEGWERGETVTVKYKGKIRKVKKEPFGRRNDPGLVADMSCFSLQIKHPYNTGKLNNIKAVLGHNPFLWFCPQQMTGEGLLFPINPKFSLVEEELAMPSACSHLSTTTLNVPEDTHVYEKHQDQHQDLTKLEPSSPLSPVPPTPGSIRTFASSSTLVDHRSHPDDYELSNVKVY
jgi:palmitoyltransferase